MSVLTTKNLTKRFAGVKAIDNLSLEIKPGQVTGLIGPNGSGKTTLINVLTGQLKIDDGLLIVNDTELSEIKPANVSTHSMTRTFQTIRLFEQMTVLDNLMVVLTNRSVLGSLFERRRADYIERAERLLRMVNLWSKRDNLAENLSYGQRKLLEIVRALAMDVNIYLFDEPFAGLFPAIREIVIAVINDLKKEGKTVILVEHDMALIRELADWVYVLDAGQLLAQGTPEEVLADKKVITAYLGS